MNELTTEDYRFLLKQFSSFYPTGKGWEFRRARKNHTDAFGKLINDGEKYFRLRIGLDYIEDFKVKEESMKQMLELLFCPKRATFLELAEEQQKKKNVPPPAPKEPLVNGRFDMSRYQAD